MGILIPYLNVLAMENRSFPISGDVLTISQQAVYAKLDTVKKIFEKNGLKCKDIPNNFDTKNKIPSMKGTDYEENTNAQTVLKLLGAENVFSCDVSDYEGADFIIDLNYPVDNKYFAKFDCILDFGTLEHVFDVFTVLSNINYMLKKGGKLILMAPCSNLIDHGFYMFSPTFFFDFFSENEYTNFSCYLSEGSSIDIAKKNNIYKYSEVGNGIPFVSNTGVCILFFAIKNTDKVNCSKPIQSFYSRSYKSQNINKLSPPTTQ
jgi:SAM-dependent methyltransferase